MESTPTADELRKAHILAFMKLTPEERLDWALSTGWEMFNALPKDKQEIFMKLRKHERNQ